MEEQSRISNCLEVEEKLRLQVIQGNARCMSKQRDVEKELFAFNGNTKKKSIILSVDILYEHKQFDDSWFP